MYAPISPAGSLGSVGTGSRRRSSRSALGERYPVTLGSTSAWITGTAASSGAASGVTGAEDIDFPHAAQVTRIRRDTYDLTGTALTKQIAHGITSLDPECGTPAVLADLTRGHWGIESVHWIRDTVFEEDTNTGYAGNGPQVMATLRNVAISLLHRAGITEINRTLQRITRDRTRALLFLPL